MLRLFKLRGSFLSRIIVATVAIFLFSIILISIINYSYNTKINDKHTSDTYQKLLSQTDYNIETLYERVFQIGEQLLNDSEIIRGLYSNELNPIDAMKVENRVDEVVSANPYINSVYLYNGETGRFIHTINKDVDIPAIDQQAVGLIDVRKKMNKMLFLPHQQSYIYDSKPYVSNILSLIFTYSGSRNGHAIFINLELKSIQDLFNKMGSTAYSNFIIVDKQGVNILNSNQPEQFMHDRSKQDFISKVIHSEAKSNHFIEQIDKKKFLITYVYNEKLEWYLINTTSYDYLSKDSFTFLRNIILISLVVLLFSIAATVLLINKIYLPFGKVVKMIKYSHPFGSSAEYADDVEYVSDVFKGLIHKVMSLEDSAVKDRNKLKEGFLRECLNQEGSMDEQGIAAHFQKLEIQLKTTNLRVLVLVMEGEHGVISNQRDTQLSLVKEAVYELALRTIADHGALEKIETGSHSMVLLMNDMEGMSDDAWLGFVHHVDKMMGIQLKIGVGEGAATMQELANSYETAREALDYVFLRDDQRIYFYDKIQAAIRKKFHYPFKLENSLLNHLKLNDSKAALENIDELFEEIEDCSIKDIHATLKQIGSNLDKVFNEIVDLSPIYTAHQMESLADVISSFVRVDMLKQFFKELVPFIIQELKGNRHRDCKEIIKQACDYIQQHYRKDDLSADSVATALHISIPYFSKLFNENMRVSFSTYVTNLRLAEAEDLLLHTSLRVKEIGEQIGFLNSTYFITVFKKKHGLSPNQFRQMKKAN
ncbi:hypothetical protein GCM10008018_31590 [Paenibacillus marchantiophytorum]|uniref:HTH araC/xylS-type domain-containing protein n=1 Tax=Paenibacillus marchantiophytorum TaxID=1619310 RepID=A0ABQ1ERL6_9BACL|nr:helix-turn-helix domain-containing protein [Paenibacillus marchantiophytorum]GFZ83310.1 hypothetical protein GCM10008018_31590 [Paenibacillus marchantiophytorum]